MGYRAYTGHAELDLDNLDAFAICERCGQLHNHSRLTWQTDYRGPGIQNLRILVCPGCLDAPNPTSKTITLPPDPVPILNPRPPSSSDLITPVGISWDTGERMLWDNDNFIIWDTSPPPSGGIDYTVSSTSLSADNTAITADTLK